MKHITIFTVLAYNNMYIVINDNWIKKFFGYLNAAKFRYFSLISVLIAFVKDFCVKQFFNYNNISIKNGIFKISS